MEAERAGMHGEQLAHALGLFGIGLGIAELTAPRAVARLIGVDSNGTGRTQSLLRGFGLREISSGLGILGGGAGPPRGCGRGWRAT